MDSICRLCAGIKKNESFVNTCELHCDINAKLEKCCQIAIYENDDLPQNVCSDCFHSLEDAWKFITKVHEAQESLQRIFSSCNESSANQTILHKIAKPIYHTIKRHPVPEMPSEAFDDNNEGSSAFNNCDIGNLSTSIKTEEFQNNKEFEDMNDDPADEYDNDIDTTCEDDSTNFDNEMIPMREHPQNSNHQLDNDNDETRDRATTSTSCFKDIRLNGKMHVILTGNRKDCRVCSRRNEFGKRHQTTYYCNTCPEKPGVHLGNCFIEYHTKQQYRV